MPRKRRGNGWTHRKCDRIRRQKTSQLKQATNSNGVTVDEEREWYRQFANDENYTHSDDCILFGNQRGCQGCWQAYMHEYKNRQNLRKRIQRLFDRMSEN